MQIHVPKQAWGAAPPLCFAERLRLSGAGLLISLLVYGEAAPRRVRRSLTANDKGDLGATERQSLSAKQAAEPQVIPQPFPPALKMVAPQAPWSAGAAA